MAGTGTAHLRSSGDVVLRAEGLTVTYASLGRKRHAAIEGLSIDLLAGETLGIVGESGCGKSTAARAVMQLPRPDEGTVGFKGVELTKLRGAAMRSARAGMQMVLQDPHSSLNPRRTVRQLVGAGLDVWGKESGPAREALVSEVLHAVGLDPQTVADRLPHTLSGGQCQRVSIARSLVLRPDVLVCDEPVSALDVSVQAQILNLLEDMKDRYQLSMIFIAHDLAVVKNVSDRIVVLYLGRVCEVGTPDEVFGDPQHPYTRLLIDSIPVPRPVAVEAAPLGLREPASTSGDAPGCRFRSRCPQAQELCAVSEPEVRESVEGHFVACHFPSTRGGE
ncbi:oligopeptide/dipeptide ABC transporter ATP-binding protein [Nocardioides sp. Bht2]|uniref:oligopeptide/dipeptide ABC transporter ATP-binding protein n=1 Tax=Nocardioides sp. Bht2 TaxID=3392297 RepID=UPI0039B3D386